MHIIYTHNRDSPESAMRGSVLLVFSSKSFFLKSPVGCVSHLVAPQAAPTHTSRNFSLPLLLNFARNPAASKRQIKVRPSCETSAQKQWTHGPRALGRDPEGQNASVREEQKKKKRREPPREKLRPSSGDMHALTSSASSSTPRLDATSPHTC